MDDSNIMDLEKSNDRNIIENKKFNDRIEKLDNEVRELKHILEMRDDQIGDLET